MISVIIPTYNRENYLKEAIDSVLQQTYQNIEIIVVDDASTDNTKEIVLSFKDKVRYIYQDNKERGAARNNGIAHAKGEFIAFLDSDDAWLPDHLESCLNALKCDNNAGLSFSHSYIINEKGAIISKNRPYIVNGFMLEKIVSNFSSFGCNASSCVIKKNILDKSGLFKEDRNLAGSEDWEMWVRISSYAKFISTNRFTAKIRSHSENSSINPEKMAKSMKKVLDIVYENNHLAIEIKSRRQIS